jgi:hypothetical protein
MLLTTILINVSFLLPPQPSLDKGPERLGVNIVKLVLALPDRCHQARRLQYFKVLGDRLSSKSDLMLHSQTRAELKEGLAVTLNQLVENRATGRSSDRLEDIAHGLHDRQVMARLSSGAVH